ncbi:hypothetical protein [Paenibacillus sonchi]|uniref:hypothetical protein n=1 Tax=Paenibacillus sonchi TaxID=373687 RepID=UPI001F1898C8|nr:hypothetical protein [Paenibacillus sonchi]
MLAKERTRPASNYWLNDPANAARKQLWVERSSEHDTQAAIGSIIAAIAGVNRKLVN